jgi:hypothetical protein
MTVRASSVLRDGYRLLGHKLTAEHRLPDADLIYFLTNTELFNLVNDKCSVELVQRYVCVCVMHKGLQYTSLSITCYRQCVYNLL